MYFRCLQIVLLRIAIADQLPRLQHLIATIQLGTVTGAPPFARALVLEQNLLDAFAKYAAVTKEALEALAPAATAAPAPQAAEGEQQAQKRAVAARTYAAVLQANVRTGLMDYLSESTHALKRHQYGLRRLEGATLTDAYVQLSCFVVAARGRPDSVECLTAVSPVIGDLRKDVRAWTPRRCILAH